MMMKICLMPCLVTHVSAKMLVTKSVSASRISSLRLGVLDPNHLLICHIESSRQSTVQQRLDVVSFNEIKIIRHQGN